MTNATDQELLPCPCFSGTDLQSEPTYIMCNGCGLMIDRCDAPGNDFRAAWNKRAHPAGVAVPDCDICHGTRRVKEPGCDEGDCTRCLSAAPHPVSGEQKAASVQITGHLDEIDAPVWEFINAEARKLGPATGSIDTYNFARPNGAQPNGVVAVLWKGASIHAMAVTVRDSLNRTQCVRLLADAPPAAQQSKPDALRKRFSDIEDEIMAGKHNAQSVFTAMRTAALYIGQPAAQDVSGLVEIIELAEPMIDLLLSEKIVRGDGNPPGATIAKCEVILEKIAAHRAHRAQEQGGEV